ncbi:hypothetical protein [Olivibacter sitiensis]|uniref:hypothetical protein n=1 Tax=Olivibacter sitiensis TaxID=376470 RepID=UPI0003FD650B|nr:hypothetical protein [Olivibacter sitiensis]
MIYTVVNSEGQPASTETNPDALFTNKQDATDYINYLHDECGLLDEHFSIVPYQRSFQSAWEFVEKFLTNYSQRDDVAKSNDLEMVVNGEWMNSECATRVRQDIIQEFSVNNGIDPEDFQVVEIAQSKLNEINATLYKEAIEGFINNRS